jgi:hypothetical protein
MMADALIIDKLNMIVLALTPIERWKAARRLDSNFMAEQWFILMAVVALITLTALLLWISYNKITEEKKIVERLFLEYAERKGLSERERQILLEVAKGSELKRKDAIFTVQNAFERGAINLMEQSLTSQSREGSATAYVQTPQESEQLKTELSLLREKLGFKPLDSIEAFSESRLSSKQIPIGKKVYITRRTTRSAEDIEARVVDNNESELTIKLKVRVKVTFSEIWRVHYYAGKTVWEFDTSVKTSDGNTLALSHSESVRLINRRRFLRVPVHNLAFISKFPFARAIDENGQESDVFSDMAQGVAKVSSDTWKPLEFVHAVVTELAGPGLRIEAPMKVKAGERILVVFKLDMEKENMSTATTSKIVEDIGEVKHSKATKNGYSIAVELIGLRDTDIRELIQATNSASLRFGTEGQEDSALVEANDSQTEIDAVEPITAQGVQQ